MGLLGWGRIGQRFWRGAALDPLSPLSVNFVKWSSQGMLRMSAEAMSQLFQPTISQIIAHIGTARGGCPSPCVSPAQGVSPLPGDTAPQPCPPPPSSLPS